MWPSRGLMYFGRMNMHSHVMPTLLFIRPSGVERRPPRDLLVSRSRSDPAYLCHLPSKRTGIVGLLPEPCVSSIFTLHTSLESRPWNIRRHIGTSYLSPDGFNLLSECGMLLQKNHPGHDTRASSLCLLTSEAQNWRHQLQTATFCEKMQS